MNHTTIIALQDECYGLEEHHKIISGVGKINATFAACVAANSGVKKIFNFGTAGVVRDKSLIGKLVRVQHIVQRDMMAMPLELRGVTPYETGACASTISLPRVNSGITLGTGDSFVNGHDEWFGTESVDIVDMEAYAIAKVCKRLNIEFECYKYVSDFADENAEDDWNNNVSKGAELFKTVLDSIVYVEETADV